MIFAASHYAIGFLEKLGANKADQMTESVETAPPMCASPPVSEPSMPTPKPAPEKSDEPHYLPV